MTRLLAIVAVLTLAIPAPAQTIILNRHAGHLIAEVQGNARFYERGGVSILLENGEIRVFGRDGDGSDYRCLTVVQHDDLTVGLTFGGTISPPVTRTYASFDDAVESIDQPDLGGLFARLEQSRVLCSSRFIRIRDRLEPLPDDGERDTALDHYLGQLDDGDWRERDRATVMLESLGEDAALWMSRVPRDAMTTEQAMRVEGLLAEYPW